MRYVVYGAGALGSLVGGRLAAGGVEVALVGRRPHVEVIGREGLEIRGEDGTGLVRGLLAVTSAAGVGARPDDRILLAVKTAETAAAVQELREHYPESTPVFCLQNGVRSEELAARRFLAVYGLSAGLCVTMPAPGAVSQSYRNDIVIGGYPLGCEAPGVELAADLRRAGFAVTISDSIMAVKWSKLVLNLNNATLAILGIHLQLAMVTPAVAAFMAEVEAEALTVLAAAGIPVDDADGTYDLTRHNLALRAVAEDPEAIARASSLPDDRRAYTSTWTDLRLRRGRTEAGYFNGEIVLLGDKYSIPTPFNSTLLYVVERMADERTPPGALSIDQLLALVGQQP